MRRTLLSGEVIDVLYYTHMLARNTLMASGDYEYLPYLVLLYAAVNEEPVPIRETAQMLDVEPAILRSAANRFVDEGDLVRTRSPLDRRSDAYSPTVAGAKGALTLNRLLRTVACDFWRTDETGIDELARAVEPFQQHALPTWPEKSDAPVTLRSLCALYTLWRDYQTFARAHYLTVSEMHMLVIAGQFGPMPAHPLYRDRNMFATNDFASNLSLTHDKGLMDDEEGRFTLSKRGVSKFHGLLSSCSEDRSIMDEPLVSLANLCERMTSHAMENGIDLYRNPVK